MMKASNEIRELMLYGKKLKNISSTWMLRIYGGEQPKWESINSNWNNLPQDPLVVGVGIIESTQNGFGKLKPFNCACIKNGTASWFAFTSCHTNRVSGIVGSAGIDRFHQRKDLILTSSSFSKGKVISIDGFELTFYGGSYTPATIDDFKFDFPECYGDTSEQTDIDTLIKLKESFTVDEIVSLKCAGLL